LKGSKKVIRRVTRFLFLFLFLKLKNVHFVEGEGGIFLYFIFYRLKGSKKVIRRVARFLFLFLFFFVLCFVFCMMLPSLYSVLVAFCFTKKNKNKNKNANYHCK